MSIHLLVFKLIFIIQLFICFSISTTVVKFVSPTSGTNSIDCGDDKSSQCDSIESSILSFLNKNPYSDDLILQLEAGIYNAKSSAIDLNRLRLEIKPQDTNSQVILNGISNTPFFTISSPNSETSSFIKFTNIQSNERIFSTSQSQTIGNFSITFQDCIFENGSKIIEILNLSSDHKSSTLSFINCKIQSMVDIDGTGIITMNGNTNSILIIDNTIFKKCTSPISLFSINQGTDLKLLDSIFTKNIGNIIQTNQNVKTYLENTTFFDNYKGFGLKCDSCSELIITNGIFMNNTHFNGSSCISISNAKEKVKISKSFFGYNYGYMAALESNHSNIQLLSTTFIDNLGYLGENIYCKNSSFDDITSCKFLTTQNQKYITTNYLGTYCNSRDECIFRIDDGDYKDEISSICFPEEMSKAKKSGIIAGAVIGGLIFIAISIFVIVLVTRRIKKNKLKAAQSPNNNNNQPSKTKKEKSTRNDIE